MYLLKQTSSLLAIMLLSACGGEQNNVESDEQNSISSVQNTTVSNEQNDANSEANTAVQAEVVNNDEKLTQILFIPAIMADIKVGGEVSSEPVTIDIVGEEPISIENGLYSIDGGKFTSAAGIIKNGAELVIKQVLPNEYQASITTTVTIGTTTLSFTNTTGDTPSNGVIVPEGAISFKSTCQPNSAACSGNYDEIAYYDANNSLVKKTALIREETSFAETPSDKSTIALVKTYENSQNALVFLSLENKHHDYRMVKGGVIPNYKTEDCKSYSVILTGLSGYTLHPGHRFLDIKATSFDVIEYEKDKGEAEVSLTSCGNEGVVISEINEDALGNSVVSYVDIPVDDIVEEDVVSLTMKEPVLVSMQVDNAEFGILTSFNADNTAHNSSAGTMGEDKIFAYPTEQGHYVASLSSNDRLDNDEFRHQFFNFSALPINNIFNEQMFDIEIETVEFNPETFTLNYSVSGNDSPSIVLLNLTITYQAVVDGVSKSFYARTSVFSQHSTNSVSFPNVHKDVIPEGAQMIEVTGKLHAIKTTYYNDLNTALGFGINSITYMPYGFSDDYESSGFFTSEYFTFFEKD